MKLVCFEDDRVGQLQPITHARPAYAITCASYQLIDWLRQLPVDLTVSVRSYLAELQSLDQGVEAPELESLVDQAVLFVNARLVPRVETLNTLKSICQAAAPGVVRCPNTGNVLVAYVPAGALANEGDSESSGNQRIAEAASPFLKSSRKGTQELEKPSGQEVMIRLSHAIEQLEENTLGVDAAKLPTFDWPHDVVAWHMKEMPAAMDYRLSQGGYRETDDGVFVADGVSIGQYASVDTSDGPILLDADVKVGPFCFLAGPVYAGPRTRIIEHSALKDGVALGHTVKIGGEVEASVIEPFTNKQHHGFLGHSYLGSWINLGAGTCNSDLKNTYGKINIEYAGNKVATGMQFLGCIMGDYSKTAINTSIFTGKVIGVCSMLYGFATSNVPSYVNYARLFGQQSLLPADVMVNTQQRMFSRRKVSQRPCDIQLINDMYHLSAHERERTEEYGF